MNQPEQETRRNLHEMLFSVLAHDLRQPFASLIMTADMLMYTKRGLSPEELHLLFEDLRNTAVKSIELLDGLLCWEKSKRDGFSYQPQPILLNDLIHEANGFYMVDQLDKNISLYNIVPERQLVYGHRQMLQFINRNILSNATRHSPAGGIIGVTCSIDEEWITVAFTDQGMGMTAHQLERLFTNENKDACKSKGAGIAMVICQDMINQMSGKIWAKSVFGEGSTFYYALPMPPV